MAAKRPESGLTVADVFDIDSSLAIVVAPETPFRQVIERFAGRSDLRGVFVVDGDGKLVGVITRHDLLHWAAHQLGVRDPEGYAWRDVYRIVSAATAADACHHDSEDCAVEPSDPLELALSRMLDYELIDIPVVDADGRILGDVRLTEILAKVLADQS